MLLIHRAKSQDLRRGVNREVYALWILITEEVRRAVSVAALLLI